MIVQQTKYYCDICKKEVDPTVGLWPLKYPKLWTISCKRYDVCRECNKALIEFIKERRENNGRTEA